MDRPHTPAVEWTFPLPRTHTGALLGNGTQGLMVWGDATLNITVARAGFWDHRGGNRFASRTSYAEVRRCLEAGDEPALRQIFAVPQRALDQPPRPTQLGGGRIELRFEDFVPHHATLDLSSATLSVALRHLDGRTAVVRIQQAADRELAWVALDEAAHGPVTVRLVPAWDAIGERLASWGVAPPQLIPVPGGGGFLQTLPEDQPLALVYAHTGASLRIATALGENAAANAAALLQTADLAAIADASAAWWRAYHAALPQLASDDAVSQHAWDYALYKLAGMTMPGGVAATLQGPWMEEYQIPPWSNDYHFNINVQMIYWPCLASGRFEHLWPMWEMIIGWLPDLRASGEAFFGEPGALLMPHAVDDRCAAVGTFWTGMIDQACSAWMAQLAWLHYRHSGDERVLREVAWPLLTGSFLGYWAMLEERDGRLSLPVSVSPEYGGDGARAWGRDASFQLAALHMLAEVLPQAAEAVGASPDPRWADVALRLPRYTLIEAGAPERFSLGGSPAPRRIALWEGQDLDESHRHHAHLGGIYPFGTIDPADQRDAAVINATLDQWAMRGAGLWSGWCLPWAAVLCARSGLPDAALHWLHSWRALFTNEGHGTLHNAAFPGVSLIWGWPRDASGQLLEIMQADAGMGAFTAVQELLVQQRGATLAVLPHLPRAWRELSFDGIWCDGGLRIGGRVEDGAAVAVWATATRDATARLLLPGAGWHLGGTALTDGPFERALAAGETLHFAR